MPERHRRERKSGWKKPPGSIIVDRTSRWGNPYKIGQDGAVVGEVRMNFRLTPFAAVWAYEHALNWGLLPYTVADVRRELAGKDVCCPCALTEPCHGDSLLFTANGWHEIRTMAQFRASFSALTDLIVPVAPAIREAS